MLRRVLVGALVTGALLASGCSDGAPEDPADALADRISTILGDDGDAVLERLSEGGIGLTADDLAAADVLCPRVTEPDPGDRATCRVAAGDAELELDVEFEDDGGLQVVQVALAP